MLTMEILNTEKLTKEQVKKLLSILELKKRRELLVEKENKITIKKMELKKKVSAKALLEEHERKLLSSLKQKFTLEMSKKNKKIIILWLFFF